jgi:hypothetical protein
MMPIDPVRDAVESLLDGGLARAMTVARPAAAYAGLDPPVPIGDPDDDEGYEDEDDEDDEEEEDDEEPLQCSGADALTPASAPGLPRAGAFPRPRSR